MCCSCCFFTFKNPSIKPQTTISFPLLQFLRDFNANDDAGTSFIFDNVTLCPAKIHFNTDECLL